MKLLILGDGLLGSEIHYQTDWEYISRKKNGFNVCKDTDWEMYLDEYDTIINCIANTNTYSLNKKRMWDTNYKFVSDLSDYCDDHGKKLIHISTDYVYSGSYSQAQEEDTVPVHNRTWYAYTKLLADAYIELRNVNYLICRCSFKERPFPYDFSFINQVGNFDFVDVIAEKIIKLIMADAKGIVNVGTKLKTMADLAPNIQSIITNRENFPTDISMNLYKMQTLLGEI